MLRSVLSVVVGVLIGSLLILGVEMLGHAVFPPAAGLDPANPESLKAVPAGAMLTVIAAWFAGAFGGGVSASLIAKRWAPAAWVVAATILLLAGATMAGLPHPTWMIAGAIVSTGLGGYLAVKLTHGYYGQPASSGPKAIL
jgi:hypothetical protein